MPIRSPLFVLSLSATLLMLGVGMIVALLPQRVHAMTGSLESVGLVASAFALAYLLAQLPAGVLSDRLGPKRLLVIGYFLCAASGLVFFVTDTAAGIYLGRAIQGVGEAPIWALGPALLSVAYPAAKGRVIGIYNAAIHAGLTLGPLLGLVIAPGGQGRLPFLAFAVLCFASGVIVMVFLKTVAAPVSHKRTTARRFLAILREKTAAVLLAGVLLYGAGYGVFISILPISLMATHGFGPTAVSLFFVLFYASVSVSQIVAGAASDRIGRLGFLVWGMALAGAGLAVFPFVPGYWAYAPLGLSSIGLGIFCVVSMAALNERVPNDFKGAISGSFYFFWGAGYVLGPLVAGAVGDSASFAGYISIAVLFGLQAMAIWHFRQ